MAEECTPTQEIFNLFEEYCSSQFLFGIPLAVGHFSVNFFSTLTAFPGVLCNIFNISFSGQNKNQYNKLLCAFLGSFCKLVQMRNTNLENDQNNLENINLAGKFKQTGSHYSSYPVCFCCKKNPYYVSPKIVRLRNLLSGYLYGRLLLQLASLCNMFLLLSVKVQITLHFLFLKKAD